MDRQPIRIEIGGNLPSNAIDDFAAAAERDGLRLDWNTSPSSAAEIADAIREEAGMGSTLILCSDDAPADMAPEAASILKAYGVEHLIRWQHPDTGDMRFEYFDGKAVLPGDADTQLSELVLIMQRPPREKAEVAVDSFLEEKLGAVPPHYTLAEDGDVGWAFWIRREDTTSYLHPDMRIEWYGTCYVPGSDDPEDEADPADQRPGFIR